MPPQEEHEKEENLVESPHQAEKEARSLEQAVDSHATLQGYYAMNNVKNSEQLEKEVAQEREAAKSKSADDEEKDHPTA